MTDTAFYNNVVALCRLNGFEIDELESKIKEKFDRGLIAWKPSQAAKGVWSLHHLNWIARFFDVPMDQIYPPIVAMAEPPQEKSE